MTTPRRLDTTDLEERVKDMYREVAEEPHKDFHFETGRSLAERLGYPPAHLDRGQSRVNTFHHPEKLLRDGDDEVP